jgi:calcium-dependent protein kinase
MKGETAERAPLDNSVFSALKNFNASCKFKQAVLGHIANNMSEDDVRKLKETFSRLDLDKSGTVTIDELKEAIKTMDASQAASVQAMMSSLDVNGDGVISYEEWMMAAAQKRLDAKEERLYQAFRQFDLDGDGHITAEEMKKVLATNNDSEIAQMIREVDQDGDGTVDYEGTFFFLIYFCMLSAAFSTCAFSGLQSSWPCGTRRTAVARTTSTIPNKRVS